MKKIIQIISILVMIIAFSLTGCKKEDEDHLSNQDNLGTESNKEEQGIEETEKNYDYSSQKGTPVTNEGILAELESFIEKIHFNYLFKPTSDTGKITETDMQLFAISYIYQYEYRELRFDLEKFVLYIPEEKVSEVIKRFFDFDFTKHKYPENAAIDYENGYYLMKAKDDKFEDKPILKEVVKFEDSNYQVLFVTSVGDQEEKYEAIVKEVDDRWILLNYKKIVTTEESK